MTENHMLNKKEVMSRVVAYTRQQYLLVGSDYS